MRIRQSLRGRRAASSLAAALLLCLAVAPVLAQDAEDRGDDETKALDSTATQWSFQFAYQSMSWKSDVLDSGEQRSPGLDNYAQLRIVAPIPLESLTLLPRLTIRHYERVETGETGFGNSELFVLFVPKGWDWGTGRVGVGPLVTFPGDEGIARNEFGYGFAAAFVDARGPWFYGVLLTQSWRAIDPRTLPAGSTTTNPLGVAPIVNYRLGGGWYVGNGDMVAQWDWSSNKLYLPIGVRFGKVLVRKKGTWNFYAEYQTSLVYKNYPGPAVDNSWRVNATYTIPLN